MNEEILGLLGVSPEQIAQYRQQSAMSGLGALGQALIQAGAPRQGPRQGTLAGIAQALPAYGAGQQASMDQVLQNILRQRQVQQMAAQQQAQQRQQTALQNLMRGRSPEEQLRVEAFPGSAEGVLFPKAPEPKIIKPGEKLIQGGEVIFDYAPLEKDVEYQKVDLGNSVAFIDPKTLATVKVIAKAKDPKDVSSGEDSVRKEFLAQAKPYIEISQAYRKIEEATKVPSAAGDVSLIFAFMKILDPGSVVREGEFATAQNAGGIPDRIRAQYNAAVDGQRLAPAQRQDFLNQAKNLARSQRQMFESQLLPFYNNISQSRGYNTNMVTSNPFEGLDLSTQQRPTETQGAPQKGRKPLGSIFKQGQ